jgi:excinuclease ABC subunit B
MAEDRPTSLTAGVKVATAPDIDAIERMEILRSLRLGQYDVRGSTCCARGSTCQVSLVAILDADKEGFLRSETSLIQTAGRAARHVTGRVILYADQVTGSMQRAISEMNRRRTRQRAYNEEHGITPQSIVKSIQEVMLSTTVADAGPADDTEDPGVALLRRLEGTDRQEMIRLLNMEMRNAAKALEFEKAASLRDRIQELKETPL